MLKTLPGLRKLVRNVTIRALELKNWADCLSLNFPEKHHVMPVKGNALPSPL